MGARVVSNCARYAPRHADGESLNFGDKYLIWLRWGKEDEIKNGLLNWFF